MYKALSLSPLLLSAGLVLSPALSASPDQRSQEEIAALISFVKDSDCVFIRNSNLHNAQEASAHIQRKYQHFYADIDSTEEFIQKSASGSSISGRPYYISCPGEKKIRSADWLQQELSRIRDAQQRVQVGYKNSDSSTATDS
ncbi:DUF5329 family protein [Agaribacterium haliotis]|uniref:DUF5329 family protein n=1 Tax=Agaribacterium haliotis TaxID=2013869 RepID=UPI000BB5527F|nr:DUF5329 family protein [Agaribacterium haliotis]